MKSMRFRFYTVIVCFLLCVAGLFGENGKTKTTIKIGEHNSVQVDITGVDKDASVEWIKSSNSSVDVVDNFIDLKTKTLLIDFTSFTEGICNGVVFDVKLKTKSGKNSFKSEPVSFSVTGVLSQQEKEKILAVKDPKEIQLKNEAAQADFKFYFLKYLIILLIILAVAFLITLIIKIITDRLKPKAPPVDPESLIPPYDRFIKKIAKIKLENEEQGEIELRLSEMSECVKDLIRDEFSFNAEAETTRELVKSLRKIDFDEEIIQTINSLFHKMDMIKFARAAADKDAYDRVYDEINLLGKKIHNYYNKKYGVTDV